MTKHQRSSAVPPFWAPIRSTQHERYRRSRHAANPVFGFEAGGFTALWGTQHSGQHSHRLLGHRHTASPGTDLPKYRQRVYRYIGHDSCSFYRRPRHEYRRKVPKSLGIWDTNYVVHQVPTNITDDECERGGDR